MNNNNSKLSKNFAKKNFALAGLLSGIAAYMMWGLFPVYFKLTANVPALELLAHRILWGLPFAALIITFRKQWSHITTILNRKKTLLALMGSALFIGINWGLYIWAVQSDNIFQASLGYYINPLVFVLIGVLFFREKLSKLQLIAVFLAGFGVALLTFYGGKFPWLSITLALAFTGYGIIRKQVDIGAVPGLFVEMSVLMPIALVYLFILGFSANLYIMDNGIGMAALIMMAGPVTVAPLVAFAFATRRLKLSTIGFLQYIGPSMQFVMALLYGEKLTFAYILCFVFIWLALAVFIWDAIKKYKSDKLQEHTPEDLPV